MPGTLKVIDEQTLANIAMLEFAQSDGTGDIFRTNKCDELSYSAVISEGAETILRVKNEIVATNNFEDIQYGSDLSFKQVIFSPYMLAAIDGGEVAVDESDEVTGYNPPAIGSPVARKEWDISVYTDIKSGANQGKYCKITYKRCKGKPVSYSFKDGEFVVPEYTTSSRPASGELPYTMEYVDELPKTTLE